MKKLVLALSALLSFSVYADPVRLENLKEVSKSEKMVPISEGFSNDMTLKVREKFSYKQENRYSGVGMQRSVYLATHFDHHLKNWNFPLMQGWYISSLKNNGCFKPSVLTVKKFRSKRSEQLGFEIWPDKSQCVIKDKIPQVYSVVFLNARYVVIATNMNNFIFDMRRGKFLQDYLVTDGKVVQYFITNSKQIAVKASPTPRYVGNVRYFPNGEDSLYLDLEEDQAIYLEKLMEFLSYKGNMDNQRKWDLDKFQDVLTIPK